MFTRSSPHDGESQTLPAPASCFPGLPVGAEPIRGNPGDRARFAGRRNGRPRSFWPAGYSRTEIDPAGRFSPPAPTRSHCRFRRAAPNSRPQSATTPGSPARAQPDTLDFGCGNHPPKSISRATTATAAGFIRHRTIRFDGHPTLPVAAIEDVVLHAMVCLAPPASTAIATSAMRLHGVPVGTAEGPAHGRPLRPGPEGAAPAGSTRRVDRGGRRAASVPASRNWLRRPGLPARDRRASTS